MFQNFTGRSSIVSSGFTFAEVLRKAMYISNRSLEELLPKLGYSWIPSAHLCIDAYTKIPHTEPDQPTYALLHVPPQEDKNRDLMRTQVLPSSSI